MFRRLIAVVIYLGLPTVALSQGEKWTPQHVAKLRYVSEAVISPDGTQVAYVLTVPRDLSKEKDGGAWTELHVVDTKGKSRAYVTGQVHVSNIAWMADGKHIALLQKFEDKPGTTRGLYKIDTRGGAAVHVTSHATDIQSFSLAGDGKRLAFLATEPTSAARKKLLEKGFNQEIYEEDQPFVRVWIAESGDGKPLHESELGTRVVEKYVDLKGSASELHWSPKEDKLAVALAPTPGIDDHLMFRKVHIVDLKTGNATDLNNPGKLGQVAWSPDGKKLAMISAAHKHDPKEGQLFIHVVGKQGWSDLSDAGELAPSHVESISWVTHTGPVTSDHIRFIKSNGVFTATGSIDIGTDGKADPKLRAGWKALGKELNGSGFWRDTFSSQVILSNESLGADIRSGGAFAGESARAYIGQAPDHPPEVYYKYILEEEPRRLTNSNPWLKNMQFADQQVIKYKARDGLELEGILILPPRENPELKKIRYPLVLTVHGGPEAHYSNGWMTTYHGLGQVAAAKGMAVFYPNYRGSTGRGVEFSMKGQKEAGGKEFDDLIDGVDHLVKMGLVDEKKVGITGGSYGGYATAWGSTYYSHRFAAGVMFVGISDWISCAGTTDIPQEMFLVHHRKWLWDDWDYFKKASPLAYLDKAKTPLLIMHGKSDPRVNPGQSLELYRHLKVRGQAPVRLVLYPGEGHRNRRAASRLDYNIRLLQWIEHYLKGPGGAMPPMEIDYGFSAPAKSAAEGTGGRPPRLPRFFDDGSSIDDTVAHVFCGRRGCPCCIGP